MTDTQPPTDDREPLCGATATFWPDVEACDAVCTLPWQHPGTRHESDTLGEWDEDDLYTQLQDQPTYREQ